MNKKKAIKLVTASALAASSFAAVAPFNTEAAVNVASSVKAATDSASKAFHAYYDVSLKGQAAPVATVQAAVKSAQTSYQAAKKVVDSYKGKDKSVYLAKLAAASKNIKLAQDYVTAVNYAAGIKDTASKLETATINKDINTVKDTQGKFSTDLSGAAAKIKALVSGTTAENAVISAYLTYPNQVLPLVKAYYFADSATYWIDVKADFATAQARLDTSASYFAKGDATTTLGKAVSAYVDQVKADFVAKQAPVVESVSAINPTKLEVKFNKAVDKDTLNKSVSINNAAVDGADLYVLSADGKTLTVTVPQFEVDKAYAVKVSGVKTVDAKEVATFVDKVLFADSEAATVSGIKAETGVSGKTKVVEVTFSEDVAAATAAANFRVDGVSPQSIAVNKNVVTLTLAADIDTTKTHELRVVELKDLSGNKTDVTQQFSITTDTTGPVADVVVKDENTLTLNFNEPVKAVDLSNVKVLKGNINVTSSVGTLSNDGKSLDVQVSSLVFGTNETSANLSVEVSGVKDVYDNVMTQLTKSVTVVKDVVAPTVTKVEGNVDTNTFTISFSEELAGKDQDAVVTLPSLFKDNMKLDVLSAKLQKDKDGNLTQVVVTTKANLVAGNYDVTLPEGAVTDNSLAKNKNAQVKLSLATTTPTPANDTVKPTVTGAVANGDVLTITYSEDVNAAAVSYSNYKINGNVISSQSIIYFNNDKKTVTIELPKGSFTAAKTDNILEVSNVADLAGNVMDKYTKLNLAVTDTAAPTLASAKVTANNAITLEFNEDMAAAAFVPGQVTIKNAGSTVVANGNSITNGAIASVDGKKVTITLTAGTLDLTKSYTIDVAAGSKLVDKATNEVSAFSNVALTDGVAPLLVDVDVFAGNTFASQVVGVTAAAIKTTAIAKADFSEVPAYAKLVYSDLDATTADVVVTGTVELNADQTQYTYSFGSANLSSLKAGTVNVNLVFVDANGNESTPVNVVSDGTDYDNTKTPVVGFDTLTLVK